MSERVTKHIIIIRQSGVLPSDFSKPKEWREVIQLRLLNNISYAELWVSSFDHYSLKQRKKQRWRFSHFTKIIKTPGYKKTVSLMRVLDAWVFSFKVGYNILLNVKKTDTIIVSLPTPESSFMSIFCSKIVGCECIIDVRDNWPENFMSNNVLKRLFGIYVGLLNKFIFRFASKIIWMSEGLKENHSKRKLIGRCEQVTIPMPYIYISHSGQAVKPLQRYFPNRQYLWYT